MLRPAPFTSTPLATLAGGAWVTAQASHPLTVALAANAIVIIGIDHGSVGVGPS